MAEIAKVIRVIGQSPTSFAEATKVAVQEAGRTVRDIHGAHVVEMSAVVENDEITTRSRTHRGRHRVRASQR